MKTSTRLWILGGALALILVGCGGGSSKGAGVLSLGITDAPVDGITSVVIEFSSVQIHSSDGDRTLEFTLLAPKQIDLVQLSGGNSTLLLDEQTLAAGQYDWIRLLVDEDHSYVVTSTGAQLPLDIPSNAESGLKLNRPFTLPADGVASFVIDFDLRKSLHLPATDGQPYILRPTLRIVDATTTGGIVGTVDDALVSDAGCADFTATSGALGGVVYVYKGSGVTPADLNSASSGVQPITTASVIQDNGAWKYTAAFLDPAVYTVAFTCRATTDDPDTDDVLVFVGPADVAVTSGQVATHDFP